MVCAASNASVSSISQEDSTPSRASVATPGIRSTRATTCPPARDPASPDAAEWFDPMLGDATRPVTESFRDPSGPLHVVLGELPAATVTVEPHDEAVREHLVHRAFG